MVRFYEIVTAALEAGNYSQAELAEQLGCSQQAVNSYYLGLTVPTGTRLRQYSPVLGCSPDELRGILEADRRISDRRRTEMARAFHKRIARARRLAAGLKA